MKLILSFILLFSFIYSNFASPLIFKFSKDVKTLELFEIGSFDASKYKQIRITLKLTDRPKDAKYSSTADSNLEFARQRLTRAQDSAKSGFSSQSELRKAENDVKEAETTLRYSRYLPFAIYSIEENEAILLDKFEAISEEATFLIDSPPSKISIKVYGEGNYKVYVYGTI